MSAHPIGLRIASKTLNTPTIGVSQYYFYNQLKQNITIRKSTKLLSKQFAIYADTLTKRSNFGKTATQNQQVLPNCFPINIALKAKQLFDTQSILNKRRLFNVAICYAKLLNQQFEKNYNRFEDYLSNRNCKVKKTVKSKVKRLNTAFLKKKQGTFINYTFQKKKGGKNIYWDSYLLFLITKRNKQLFYRNQFTFLTNFFFFNNSFLKHNQQKQKLQMSLDLDKFFFQVKERIQTKKTLTVNFGLPQIKHQKGYLSYKRSLLQSKDITLSLPFTKSENLPLNKNYKTKDTKVSLIKKRLCRQQNKFNKINLSAITLNESILLLICLAQLSSLNKIFYQSKTFCNKSYNKSVTVIAPSLIKEILFYKQKRLYINNNQGANTQNLRHTLFTNTRAHTISYTLCTNSNLIYFKNISKKLTKQIGNFRSDVKLLMPLALVIHRNFSEPIGLNYISTLENPLAKTYYSLFVKNFLFTRTANNFFKSNYMNTQRGLIRLKDAILFDFAYTKKVLIQPYLKKSNAERVQQLLETGHKKLWLRKISSIRL